MKLERVVCPKCRSLLTDVTCNALPFLCPVCGHELLPQVVQSITQLPPEPDDELQFDEDDDEPPPDRC